MNVCLEARGVDLLAQAPDADVDGAVAVGGPPAPDSLEQLVPARHAAAVLCQRVEQPELGRRQLGVLAVDERLHRAGVDPQLLDHQLLAAVLVQAAHAAARRGLDAGDELLHRERLDQVVVGADLERVHAVVLGAARRDDQDRRADPLGARLLDQRPAVEAGQHQIEHEHVGPLVPQPCEADLARTHADRVEPGRVEVLRHALGDRVVVFDDQDLGHAILTLMTDPDYEALRTAFTASVSHELRTPLARLSALLESAELPDADLQGLLRQAQDEVVEMTELVDDVLFLSELEQGREIVALGDTEAAPVLRAVVDELTERAELAGLAAPAADRGRDDPRSASSAHAPAGRREPARERPPLRRRGCDVHRRRSAREDGYVVVGVSDDGSGVPDEDVPRLFERFFRSDRARTTRGTGLGLAIVKHVIESAGGNVEARGGQGHGLDVRCALPV